MFRLTKILRLLFNKFGFKFIYLIIPVYRLVYSLINYIGLLFDELFFRDYRKIKIKKPVLLVGHPRSGTTFLHKFILKNCEEFEGMHLWRMIFSSIFLRKLVQPILPFLSKIFPNNLYDPNIHKTGLLEPETDDAALFFRNFDGMFNWLYFSALNKYDTIEDLEYDLIKTTKLEKVLSNLNVLYQKNMYKSYATKRIFSKSFSFILDLKDVKNTFRDSKLIVLIRDPLEVIPSSMSLARNVQMNLNDFTNLNEADKKNYYKNLYYASLVFYKSLYNQVSNNLINRDDFLLVSYKDLINDFESTMNKICKYSEIEITPQLSEAIIKQANKQKSYKGKHEYTLEEFGLKREEILKDFDFLYSNFDI